nr:BREX-2 system adenine-specific DNA-methyltransferase PglX [Cellulomonas humilata]
MKDLRGQLKLVETDLRRQAGDSEVAWSGELREQFDHATAAGRTGLTWSAWRDGEISQAAVAWLIAATFIRFCEDNDLLEGAVADGQIPVPWIAGPTDTPTGSRVARAVEHQTGYFTDHPARNDRHWWREAFSVLANLPAGKALVDPAHNPVWRADISPEAARALLEFFRRTDESGALAHDFTDADLDTRFLGDLYQDLSEYAKKTFALLQTPVFVEEFILDRTLEPAIAEFGLKDFKMIDPTCGSGHFLLGAFDRLLAHWTDEAPGLDRRERVQRALDSIHGVDLNPFAVAIARFRLTVSALRASGDRSLLGAPVYRHHVAIGDSLLGEQGTQGDLLVPDETFLYATEDIEDYRGVLTPGRYHSVVGNPPYITVKDKTLSESYRRAYSMCRGKYALSVPFMELFFRLAARADGSHGAGFVGQITANSFMKREFGRPLVEILLAGRDESNPVDLRSVIDTSGAYIPGHGTPTVILIGRRRRPLGATVRAALGVRGEPGQPTEPATGLVWTDIVDHLDEPGYQGPFVTVSDLDRDALSTFPWSLTGGGAGDLKARIDSMGTLVPRAVAYRIGVFGIMGADDAFMVPPDLARRLGEPDDFRPLVVGEQVRDFQIISADPTFFPYGNSHVLLSLDAFPASSRRLWSVRCELGNRATFSGQTYFAEGRPYYEWHQLPKDVGAHVWSITFAYVATHNHFVLDRGGKAFGRTAPVIKLPASATEEDHFNLLAILNTSTACFWLKQVSHNKGRPGAELAGADEPWEHRYEFTSTKVQEFPLPAMPLAERGRVLDALGGALSATAPVEALDVTSARMANALAEAEVRWNELRGQLVFEQEELDWASYQAYGLTDEDFTYGDADVNSVGPSERAFAIALARDVDAGRTSTTWFTHHNHKFAPTGEIPTKWPSSYRALIERRLVEIESNPNIRLLERPEYKRRWATRGWDALEKDAVTAAVLDRLENAEHWRDASGPVTRSVAELADLLRDDRMLIELLERLAGGVDVDVVPALERLIAEEAVPYLAALRYKASGVEKFREWQHAWELQREEDRIESGGPGTKPTIAVPPKYGQFDFLKPAYWKARGKLDVPKERFIAYHRVTRTGEGSTVLGWAGWNYAEQGLALARLVGDVKAAGAMEETVIPLLAGLTEVEPWVAQWHNEIDPAFGTSPAAAVSGFLDGELHEYGVTRDGVTAWTPRAATRGRPRKDA